MKSFIAFAITASLALPLLAADGPATTFDALVEQYEPIRTTLLKDSTSSVAEHARAIASIAAKAEKKSSAERLGVEASRAKEAAALLPTIRQAAERVAAAGDLAAARAAFADLTAPMLTYRELAVGDRPAVAYCPMLKKQWLQPKGEIGNPYAGSSMPRCGQIVSK